MPARKLPPPKEQEKERLDLIGICRHSSRFLFAFAFAWLSRLHGLHAAVSEQGGGVESKRQLQVCMYAYMHAGILFVWEMSCCYF
jgi:hypothetical protein